MVPIFLYFHTIVCTDPCSIVSCMEIAHKEEWTCGAGINWSLIECFKIIYAVNKVAALIDLPEEMYCNMKCVDL